MSYRDYLDGLRDGISIGFKAGFRAGFESGARAGYLTGYDDGYKDASLGLPYSANERLRTYQPPLPDPIPTYEPPLFEPIKYEPPKIDLTPKLPEVTYCGEIGCPGHSGFGGRCLPKAGPGLRLGPPGGVTW